MGTPKKFAAKPGRQQTLWDVEDGTVEQENTIDDSEKPSDLPPSTQKPNSKPSSRATGSTKGPSPTKPKSKPAATSTTAVKKAPPARPKVRRPFPQNTLEEALVVPQAVREKNNGKPLEPAQVAKACNNLSAGGEKFFYLAGSSRDYGLTTGSRDTDVISLTELGQSIVYPETAEQQRQDKIKAFFTGSDKTSAPELRG